VSSIDASDPTAPATPTTASVPVPPAGDLVYRPARADELGACAEIWRTSINDYIGRLGQPEIPPDLASIGRLYTHLRSTDPERFVVAVANEGSADGDPRVVGFAAAVERERLWYLSMCFVLPELQGTGVGRALLAAAGPSPGTDRVRATATDSAQPISNALYAAVGIVPRVPLFDLIGHALRPEAFGALPSGVRPVSFEDVVGEPGGSGDGHRALAETVDALDRETLGVAHPIDHRFLRTEGRHGWLYHGPDGRPLAYGYAAEAGRIGPIAVLDPDLVAPVIGHLSSVVTPRGAAAIWLPGSAGRALTATLRAGFRMDPFPVLLCWDRPFADLARYLPISPGLL
jgi:GNAT superfamily N-acetyltransferase